MGRGVRTGMAALMLALAIGETPAGAGQAQQAVTIESLAGTWEGTAQTPEGEAALKALFTVADGKLGGTVESSLGPIAIASAALTDGKLSIAIEYQGSPGTLNGTVQGARIEGTWEVMGATGTFVLSRRDEGATDPITGGWDGEANVQGQIMPFSMFLHVAGETVTGEMSSAAGTVQLTSGSWKNGTLLLAFPYEAGEPVAMSGALTDGKLTGALDYNRGEAAGTFTASRTR